MEAQARRVVIYVHVEREESGRTGRMRDWSGPDTRYRLAVFGDDPDFLRQTMEGMVARFGVAPPLLPDCLEVQCFQRLPPRTDHVVQSPLKMLECSRILISGPGRRNTYAELELEPILDLHRSLDHGNSCSFSFQ